MDHRFTEQIGAWLTTPEAERDYKAGEKLAESEEDLLKHRPYGTTAFSPIRSKLLRGRHPLHRLRKIPI